MDDEVNNECCAELNSAYQVASDKSKCCKGLADNNRDGKVVENVVGDDGRDEEKKIQVRSFDDKHAKTGRS